MIIYYMRKFDETTQKSNSWIKDGILLIYIFIMLIFRNEFVLRFGEEKFYLFIFIGGFGVLLAYQIIFRVWAKMERKNKKEDN